MKYIGVLETLSISREIKNVKNLISLPKTGSFGSLAHRRIDCLDNMVIRKYCHLCCFRFFSLFRLLFISAECLSHLDSQFALQGKQSPSTLLLRTTTGNGIKLENTDLL